MDPLQRAACWATLVSATCVSLNFVINLVIHRDPLNRLIREFCLRFRLVTHRDPLNRLIREFRHWFRLK